MKKIDCRVKFYADTPAGEINKLFTWKVGGINEVAGCVARFKSKRFRIRAVYLEYLDRDGRVLENFRVAKECL